MALPVSNNEKIVEAVVVIVADSHSHSHHFDVESCSVRHISERAVVIVVIKLGRRMLQNMAGPVHAVRQKNVRPAVVVIVNKGHARSHGFRQEFLPESTVVVNESNPGLLSDIAKGY